MKKKLVTLVALALAFTMAFAVVAHALPNDGEPATIRFAWWGGDAREAAVLEAIEIFMDRYPHITVEPVPSVFGGYLDNLIVQLQAGTEADVLQSNYAWVHSLGFGRNPFLDLNTVSHILDLTEWSDELIDFVTTADGEIAGVPHGTTGRVLIYDREMVEAHGFETFPATFDELVELGIAVAEGNAAIDAGDNTYVFFPIGAESWDIIIMTIIYNEIGVNLQYDGQILPTVDEVEAVFELIGELIEFGVLPTWEQQEAPLDTSNPVWTQGRGGALFEWVGNIFLAGGNFMEGDLDRLGVALMPTLEEGGTQYIMQRPSLVHAISANTDYPEVAAYFLNFLYTDEEALMALGNQFGIPLSATAAYISEREENTVGLQLEGLFLLEANVGEMCALFEDPNLRPARFAAIEAFRTGAIDARTAAERWVNDQQSELDLMN